MKKLEYAMFPDVEMWVREFRSGVAFDYEKAVEIIKKQLEKDPEPRRKEAWRKLMKKYKEKIETDTRKAKMICCECVERLIKYLSLLFPKLEIYYARIAKQPDYPWNHAVVCVINPQTKKFCFVQTIDGEETDENIISPRTIKEWETKRWWTYIESEKNRYEIKIEGEKVFLNVYPKAANEL